MFTASRFLTSQREEYERNRGQVSALTSLMGPWTGSRSCVFEAGCDALSTISLAGMPIGEAITKVQNFQILPTPCLGCAILLFFEMQSKLGMMPISSACKVYRGIGIRARSHFDPGQECRVRRPHTCYPLCNRDPPALESVLIRTTVQLQHS